MYTLIKFITQIPQKLAYKGMRRFRFPKLMVQRHTASTMGTRIPRPDSQPPKLVLKRNRPGSFRVRITIAQQL